MIITDYTAYFSHIATIYSKISSFFEASLFDEDKLKDKLRGAQAKPLALIIEPYSRISVKNGTGNEQDAFSCSYIVLDKLQQKDFGKVSALANAELAMKEIRARMQLDHESQCRLLDGLEANSWRADPVGMIANEWAGWRMEFLLMEEEPPVLTAEHWTAYTPFTSRHV